MAGLTASQAGVQGNSAGEPAAPPDDQYLIAATALTDGLELAALNVRRYPMFPGLARPF